MQTASVPASIRLRSVGSSSTLPFGPAGRAERDQRAGGQHQLVAGTGEELDVLRVGARPAAFDVAHPQQVELLGDPQLVLDAGRDALDLKAVAQRGVEDLYRIHWLLTWFLTFWLFVMVSASVVDDSSAAAAAGRRNEEAAPEGGSDAHAEATCATE